MKNNSSFLVHKKRMISHPIITYLTKYFISPILDVGTNPLGALITSGILFTIVAQVNSTVEGLLITKVVLGSPIIVYSFLSNSLCA